MGFSHHKRMWSNGRTPAAFPKNRDAQQNAAASRPAASERAGWRGRLHDTGGLGGKASPARNVGKTEQRQSFWNVWVMVYD